MIWRAQFLNSLCSIYIFFNLGIYAVSIQIKYHLKAHLKTELISEIAQ